MGNQTLPVAREQASLPAFTVNISGPIILQAPGKGNRPPLLRPHRRPAQLVPSWRSRGRARAEGARARPPRAVTFSSQGNIWPTA